MTIKAGDKVLYTGPTKWDLTTGKVYEVIHVGENLVGVMDDAGDVNYICSSDYEIVTDDTPQAPTLWGDMTPQEKGALLLAKHQGKVIEGWYFVGQWVVLNCPLWLDGVAYRVAEPKPIVKTEALYWDELSGCAAPSKSFGDTHRITFDTIDGEPDATTIKMDKI